MSGLGIRHCGTIVMCLPVARLVAELARACRASVAQAIDTWQGDIIVDLANITETDAGGLALLAFAAQRGHGRVRFAGVNCPTMRTLVDVTRLDEKLAFHVDVESALAAIRDRVAPVRAAA
jgi:anti-anti-sigma regulatory factor